MSTILQYVLYLLILIALAVPLGGYIGKVMNGEKVLFSRIFVPCENAVYRMMHVDKDEEMSWKRYLVSALAFSALFLLTLFLIIVLQGVLPLNPEHIGGMSLDLAFNTAASFVTNTNWQAYSGEAQLSYFSQMIGLTVQNFVSAAVGICVLFALIRGFTRVKKSGLGNFWVDLTRTLLYVLLPLSVAVSIILVSQGVVQNLDSYKTVQLVEPLYVDDAGGAIIPENDPAVAAGKAVKITEEVVPMGPAASQIAIKQLGTNGGGFFGVNSAHPFENPTILSNLVEMISLLLIPAALCFTFGRNVKDKKQGRAVFLAMFLMLVLALAIVAVNEQAATPQYTSQAVDVGTDGQAGGNMEGKESRFGIAASATWGTFTTAASNGSVNSMHDSFTPIGGMITMLLMMLGEVVFGGVGCGLYGMLGFAIFTVFIAGLMVGRTPEYLGKKIEPFEMKMAACVCLATPVAVLAGSGIAAALEQVLDSLNNGGAHGFSELLYAYSSAGGNNGSAFAGFGADTVFLNVSIGLCMLVARFVPMAATLAMAGSLVQKQKIAATAGTLSTSNAMFVFLLIFIVLLVGALSFFPALALGPIVEYLQMAGTKC